MRRLVQRGMVVALIAGMSVTMTTAMAQPAGIATHTTLATESHEIGRRTTTTYSAAVLSDDGTPAKGIVQLQEQGKNLAGAALDAEGKAELRFDGLSAGDHNLRAVYLGDLAHAGSKSETAAVHSDAAAASFVLSINPTSLPASGQQLSPGDSGNVVATITSMNGFTGFVSLSCAGAPVSPGSATDMAMPIGVTCTFTPANLQITSAIANSATPTAVSYLTVQTTAPAGQDAQNRGSKGVRSSVATPLALAMLFPGVIGLGLLGRKRKLFGRTALILMVGTLSVLATTACNARYKYLNHPPTANDGTPTGAYTLTVWAQTSDGVTASEQFTTLGLTVK